MNKNKQISIFNKRAKKLLSLDLKTRKIFAAKYRQQLLKTVSGKTLEVAVGTGANFKYYPCFIELTAVDFSKVLIDIAQKNAISNNLNVHFIESDVETLNFPENSFDSIVSTLSLCSYSNPIKILNNFDKWCKPNGTILLLEHGLSSNKLFANFINLLLNIFNHLSIKYMGDNINTDILKITKESDLIIENIKTFLFDTHYLIWAKPSKIIKCST